MIYKPRCEYAHAHRKTSALYCSKVKGYCAFQYRCELTGQYENTATAVKCKARNNHEQPEPTLQSVYKGGEILNTTSEAVAIIGKRAAESTLPLNEADAAISQMIETQSHTIEPESERSTTTDEMEQSEHTTTRRTSGTKRGRRKKRDNVSANAVQASTGGTTD